ncbi:MAG: hypothetical protein LAN62_11705 [Acidobacteriia bacterium]|nr:hypothetical protein [Terriglobia bacterium]
MSTEKEREITPVTVNLQGRSYTGAFVTIGMLLAFLFVANLYILDRLTSSRQETENLRSAMSKQMEEIKGQNQELLLKYSVLKAVQANQIDQLRSELDMAAKRLGASTGQVLDRARAMVGALQKEHVQHVSLLENELSQKADAGDLVTLSANVSQTQGEVGSAQRTLDVLAADLGATRTELGGLAANTRDQIQALRELADKDRYELTLVKNRVYRVGHVGLLLKKTNVKGQNFDLTLLANDQEIRNKNRTANEPILFYVGRLQVPYELVITGVGSDSAVGYLRIPKVANLENAPRPRT